MILIINHVTKIITIKIIVDRINAIKIVFIIINHMKINKFKEVFPIFNLNLVKITNEFILIILVIIIIWLKK